MPIRSTNEAKTLLAEIADQLRDFWTESGRWLDKYSLFAAIEEQWGEFISERVCKQLGMAHGECIFIAIDVASESAGEVPAGA